MKFRPKFRKCALEVERNGWYRQLDRHFVAFRQRGPRLVVTFDNMKSRDMPGPRYPWGWSFVEAKGASHLGICMSRRNDWFRHPSLFDLFDELQQQDFFRDFDDVVFYGSSMGGYGALAFAAAAPGSRVVAFVPQTTLCPTLVPFETRFANGRKRGDYEDRRYVDGRDGALAASHVSIFYDPYHAPDQKHVERLAPANLTLFRAPFMGHKVPRVLRLMGNLRNISSAALENQLTEADFRAELRGRKEKYYFVKRLLNEALERGHDDLVARALARAEARTGRSMAYFRDEED
ncbi:hypothetical protein ACRARG_16830 [Pseudooceanicola sp. C21-150M6]|uniref:hypothetical protein n=1 Tax=Pseudooceanicola sp. C21-150M6 TaxID=3434355 RepID=UPI003D7F987F